MANDLVPEQPVNTGPEKLVAKPIEAKPLEQPVGPKEEGIIDRIDRDGNPDSVLGDIASGNTLEPQQQVTSNSNAGSILQETTPIPNQNEAARPVNLPSVKEPQRPFQELPYQTSSETAEADKSATFDVITQEQIDAYKNMLSERYGIDLSDVSINVVRPGDELFDKEEIKFNYFQHASDPAFSELGSLLEQYEENPQNVSVDRLRDVARNRGIAVEGKMPGFAAMSGDKMVFFAVQEKDAISMAQRYAEKEGDASKTFKTPQEAIDYLKGLGEKAFLHEVGHIVYDRKGEAGVTGWNSFVEGDQPLIDRVSVIQQDKYEHVSDIPIAEEAFADYFVNVVGDGRVVSRLGNNLEAQDLVSQMLTLEQPNNTADPGEVTENLKRLRESLSQATPFELPQNPANSNSQLNEFGELKDSGK